MPFPSYLNPFNSCDAYLLRLQCNHSKPVRVGFKRVDGKRIRVSKKTGAEIPLPSEGTSRTTPRRSEYSHLHAPAATAPSSLSFSMQVLGPWIPPVIWCWSAPMCRWNRLRAAWEGCPPFNLDLGWEFEEVNGQKALNSKIYVALAWQHWKAVTCRRETALTWSNSRLCPYFAY